MEYKKILNNLPESVIIVDESLNILHANVSYSHMTSSIPLYDTKFPLEILEEIKPRAELSNSFFREVLSTSEIQHKVAPRVEVQHIQAQSGEARIESDQVPFNPSHFGILIKRLISRDTLRVKQNSEEQQYYCFDGVVNLETPANKIVLTNGDNPEKSLHGKDGSAPPSGKRNVEIRVGCGTFLNKTVAIIFMNDVSQLRENIELKQQNKFKTLLLGSVSHEVRSPLGAAISLLTCAANDPQVPEPVKTSYINLALTTSKLLLNIVNDFLDYTQLDFNKIRIVPFEFNLRDKVDEIIQLLTFQAAAKHISLCIEYEAAGIPPTVLTDSNRLSQVLFNVLNNALKFTEKGSVTLKVRRVGGNSIQFSVADTGVGISPQDRAKLFKQFTKIDLGSKRKLNASGVGLGLYST
jgi:nitrogen-specific signal transduction histidine kinase